MEEWKDIKDYEGYYQISSYGQVTPDMIKTIRQRISALWAVVLQTVLI